MVYFQVRYASRVVIYELKTFIRLATVIICRWYLVCWGITLKVIPKKVSYSGSQTYHLGQYKLSSPSTKEFHT